MIILYNGKDLLNGENSIGMKLCRKHFPDGTLLMKESIPTKEPITITWLFENNEEWMQLYFLVRHFREHGIKRMELKLPYIPNARQDRVKDYEDVFTLKYFAELLNSLKFDSVTVLDPHSYVSEALIHNIRVETPKKYVEKVLAKLADSGNKEILLYFPDEGAMKRYAGMFDMPYVFGMKKRDWKTGKIQGLEILGQKELVLGSQILIIDDICSRGGTFYHSAKALKELGANDIYLYISHCENSILGGELIGSGLVKRIYTTNSIFTESHERIEVLDYE